MNKNVYNIAKVYISSSISTRYTKNEFKVVYFISGLLKNAFRNLLK